MVYAQAKKRVKGINPTSLRCFACVDFTAVNNLREIIFEKIASLFLKSYTEPCEERDQTAGAFGAGRLW